MTTRMTLTKHLSCSTARRQLQYSVTGVAAEGQISTQATDARTMRGVRRVDGGKESLCGIHRTADQLTTASLLVVLE